MEQQPARIEVTRHALYEQIWSMPVSRACRTYGLSDVGLAKICASWDIPRPPRGYWEKKRNGKPVKKTKLKSIEEGDPVIFSYQPGQSDQPAVAPALTESDRQRDLEKRAENRISVPDELVAPHPFVVRTEKSIRSAKPDEHGTVRPKAQQCLDVAVSAPLIDRSLRIMNALLIALEARGFRVSISDHERPQTEARVLDENIGFQLHEEIKRREREPTPAEKRDDDFWRTASIAQPIRKWYEWAPTGRLILHITDGQGLRRTWTDRKDRLVEQFLNTFVVGLVRAAEAVKQDRVDAEKRRREFDEAQRRRHEEELRRREDERRQQEEDARCRQLDAQVASWWKAEQIRAFVAAVRDACLQRNGNVTPGSELDQWMEWAMRRANALDPIHPLRTSQGDDSTPQA